MSDNEKLNPQGLLGKDAIEAAGLALIFGYHLRTVKVNGNKAISDAKFQTDGYNAKRWDIGVVNGIVTELWVPPSPPATPVKTK